MLKDPVSELGQLFPFPIRLLPALPVFLPFRIQATTFFGLFGEALFILRHLVPFSHPGMHQSGRIQPNGFAHFCSEMRAAQAIDQFMNLGRGGGEKIFPSGTQIETLLRGEIGDCLATKGSGLESGSNFLFASKFCQVLASMMPNKGGGVAAECYTAVQTE